MSLSRLSLRVKLTSLVVIIVAVASWSFAKLAYSGLVGLLEQVSGLRAVTVAEAFAATVDPTSLQNATAGSDDLVDLEERLGRMVRSGRVHRVEVIRFVGRAQIQHMLSLPADNTPDHHHPGKIEDIRIGDVYGERKAGFSGVQLGVPGAFMGGWAPVAIKGEPIGLVLIAIDVSDTQSALDTAYVAIITAMLTLILLAGLVAYKFAATFEKTAVTDGLMQIYNHKYFKQRLEEEVARARRYGSATSIVFLDIDFFKRVNDTYGHATGDLVLKQMAKWVTESTRTTDVVARYGGEEVAVILPHTGLAGAQEFAERLRIKVSEQYIHDPEENAKFRVTVSVGVAQWEKGLTMMDLIKRADAALYHSKNTGRNRVTIYQDEILTPMEHIGR